MTYTDRNQREIRRLDPAAQHKVHQATARCELVGEDFLIVDGRRTPEEQDRKYAQGRWEPGKIVTWVDDSNSMHVQRVAIDLVPVGPLGVKLKDRGILAWWAKRRYRNIAREFMAAGFEWGYDLWEADRPHFQYRQELTIEDFKNGEKLDLERARTERKQDLAVRIEKAEKALERRFMLPGRRKRLQDFVNVMRRKLGRL